MSFNSNTEADLFQQKSPHDLSHHSAAHYSLQWRLCRFGWWMLMEHRRAICVCVEVLENTEASLNHRWEWRE